MKSDRARAVVLAGLGAASALCLATSVCLVWLGGLPLWLVSCAFVGAVGLYAGVRILLAAGDRVPQAWDPALTAVDLLVITGIVRLTGGADSEAGLLYVWPFAAHCIRHTPRAAMATGAAGALLYLAATWPEILTTEFSGRFVARVALGLAVALLVAAAAAGEVRRVEERSRQREQAALAEYRGRLSQEMHDGIQHYLLCIGVRLDFARKMLAQNPVRAAAMAVDQGLTVRQAADELHHLVRGLRSPAIERRGLIEAVRAQLAMCAERAGISAPLDVRGTPRPLPPDTEQAAFRIIQEALTNAERHAQPTQVRVTMSYRPDAFECVVADDGAGFEPSRVPSEPPEESGFGLCSMRERAEQVGGRLEVDSGPGRGTRVRFLVALEPQLTGAVA